MSKKIILHDVRLSYEHVFTPSAMDDNQEPKYSATFILPKNHPDVAALRRALFEAGQEKYPTSFTGSAWPRGYTCAMKDGDKDEDTSGILLSEKNPEYAGCYIVRASSSKKITVVDRKKSRIDAEDGVIYSGCYVNASIAVAGYEFGKVKKGITAYLNGIQFVRDGERFGSDALSDFDDLDGGEDDFLS